MKRPSENDAFYSFEGTALARILLKFEQKFKEGFTELTLEVSKIGKLLFSFDSWEKEEERLKGISKILLIFKLFYFWPLDKKSSPSADEVFIDKWFWSHMSDFVKTDKQFKSFAGIHDVIVFTLILLLDCDELMANILGE